VSATDGQLLSHPDKPLSRHIAEVREAARAILRLHSPDAEREKLVEEIVSLHDLGKASAAFQKYIRDTSGYRDNRNKKAHTPVGFAATLLLGERLERDPFWKLCVAAAVLGHHTGFPNSRRLTDQYLLSDDWKEVIDEQAANIPVDKVSELTGFPLAEILSDPNLRYNAFFVADKMLEAVKKKAESEISSAVADRLKMQFAFSVLLEADKAFLALSPDGRSGYRKDRETRLSPRLVEEHLREADGSEINALRTNARKEALYTLLAAPDQRLWTLALPTGLGKTLTAASLALNLRERSPIGESGPRKRIILVLPFLAIIDQTAKVYADLLKLKKPRPSIFMQSHSLSERVYDTEEQRDAEFFLDTWDSEIVVTTFDQFLLSLLGDRARHQMRFHNLADAVLIFDEVQALPTQLWDIVNHALTQLTEHLGSTAILMSATQPGFVEETGGLIQTPERYYEKFGRYRLVLKHKTPTKLEDFIESVLGRRDELERKRFLITLNTRASAREVRRALTEAAWGAPVYFLTADVTPKDRLAAIDEIKKYRDEPCLVVSTQVIEAGVDVDMSLVIRDFAPLDSLIQVAGRCNRNRHWPRKDVEIYHLTNATDRSFAEMVYTVGKGSPDVRLEETRKVLKPYESVPEENVLGICDDYFARLRDGKDLGRRHTRNWASLAEEQPNIRELLRGERTGQVQLIVAERDEGDLIADIETALNVRDRWERRRALRNLAGRIARLTVSVWVKGDWHPTDVANPLGHYDSTKPLEHPWWIVRPGNYDPKSGLRLEGEPFL
jgi:CRISPR-associated endonuclease/helicase Cas3